MNTRMIVAGLVTVSVALASVAQAKPRKAKLVVCESYTEATVTIDGAAEKVALCADTGKVVVLHDYVPFTAKGEEGGSVKAIAGWR